MGEYLPKVLQTIAIIVMAVAQLILIWRARSAAID